MLVATARVIQFWWRSCKTCRRDARGLGACVPPRLRACRTCRTCRRSPVPGGGLPVRAGACACAGLRLRVVCLVCAAGLRLRVRSWRMVREQREQRVSPRAPRRVGKGVCMGVRARARPCARASERVCASERAHTPMMREEASLLGVLARA